MDELTQEQIEMLQHMQNATENDPADVEEVDVEALEELIENGVE